MRDVGAKLCTDNAATEHDATFGAHVKEEIDDAHVGHEAVTLGKDLVVGRRAERGVEVVGNLWADGFAKVCNDLLLSGLGLDVALLIYNNVRVKPESVENEVAQRGVEVD